MILDNADDINDEGLLQDSSVGVMLTDVVAEVDSGKATHNGRHHFQP